MKNCVFCKIIKKEIPSTKVYEDDYSLVILDIRPASKKGGHTLVIPKKHYELISDIPDEVLTKISLLIKKVSKALLKFGEGLNVLQNNKKVAGQAIPHVHFHLIPRFQNDGIRVEKFEVFEYKNGEAKKTADKIRSFLK